MLDFNCLIYGLGYGEDVRNIMGLAFQSMPCHFVLSSDGVAAVFVGRSSGTRVEEESSLKADREGKRNSDNEEEELLWIEQDQGTIESEDIAIIALYFAQQAKEEMERGLPVKLLKNYVQLVLILSELCSKERNGIKSCQTLSAVDGHGNADSCRVWEHLKHVILIFINMLQQNKLEKASVVRLMLRYIFDCSGVLTVDQRIELVHSTLHGCLNPVKVAASIVETTGKKDSVQPVYLYVSFLLSLILKCRSGSSNKQKEKERW